jgi:2,3,4,5-tetrahydropyridine-2,6-dicarboxylate N-succinyltransferase
MTHAALEAAIEAAWEARDTITPATGRGARRDRGDAGRAGQAASLRVAEKRGGRLACEPVGQEGGAAGLPPEGHGNAVGRPAGRRLVGQGRQQVQGLGPDQWRAAGFRAVPNCVVRRSAFIAKGVVLMPSFVNLGAYVDEGTMVDTWATVGSCAQIGKNVHLSGGVGIGGVLEPMQAGPTIIEDNCFIGARSEVVEGCIVREGSVLGMGVFIGKSTKIVDRETGA